MSKDASLSAVAIMGTSGASCLAENATLVLTTSLDSQRYQGSTVYACVAKGLRIVSVSQDYAETQVRKTLGLLRARRQQRIRMAILFELAGDGTGYGIVVREDHVTPGVFWQPSGDASGGLGLHEGQIEELYQGERKQNEHEHHAREEHEGREYATQVAGEGYVTVPQRRHGRERPVDARQPRELPAFDCHQLVKDQAVDHD